MKRLFALFLALLIGLGSLPVQAFAAAYGDADGNGKINARDAMLILQFYTQSIQTDALDTALCDVDADGQCNAKDAMLVLQFYTQKIQEFPAQAASKPDLSAWNLILVNAWNPVSEGFSVKLKYLQNGHAVDTRIYPDLQEMMDAMRAEGLSPLICSSYRSQKDQQILFSNRIQRYLNDGYTLEEAEALTPKSVAYPGTSEHHLGLAVDIVDKGYQKLGPEQEKTAVQQWLIANSWQYGFILRYPRGKYMITGIYYEPWHYRYVGREAAREIYEAGICFEEYLEQYKS